MGTSVSPCLEHRRQLDDQRAEAAGSAIDVSVAVAAEAAPLLVEHQLAQVCLEGGPLLAP
jgi:hypothetical protein